MSRFRIIEGLVAVGLMAALSGGAMAQSVSKIGVVNVQALLEESPQAKAASQALQEEFAPRQRELQAKQKELQAKQDKLTRDSAVMSDSERSTMEKELRNGERDLQSKGQAFQEELNSRRNEELGKLQARLLQEVQSFAKAGNFDLVVPANAVLFTKEALDVTAQVLAAWQAHGGATAAPKPAAPASKPTK